VIIVKTKESSNSSTTTSVKFHSYKIMILIDCWLSKGPLKILNHIQDERKFNNIKNTEMMKELDNRATNLNATGKVRRLGSCELEPCSWKKS
jgi:hypothetical protein